MTFAAVAAASCGDAAEPPEAGSGGSGQGIVTLTGAGTTAAEASSGADETHGFKLDLAMGVDAFAGDTSSEECDGLEAVIRDFSTSHPDFEVYGGNEASVGLVMTTLGADSKPVFDPSYAGAQMITSADTFAQWYQDVPGTNEAFPIELMLVEETPGEFSFDSTDFFPIDGQGFGDEDNPHNFHFTTEVHTSFTYAGGEVFTFRGDDDLWMFVDGQLAIDLGGLHPALEASVEMDTLGLTAGETYPMDIFHAERHTDESNFRIVTTIECFVTPPPQG